MSTLIRKGKVWWPALFAAARYVLYNVVLTYGTWLHSKKDSWDSLTSWDMHDVTVQLVLAMLVAIGAIMNRSWHIATEKEKAAQ